MRESVPSRHIRTVLGLVMALCLVGGIAACEFPTEKQLAKPLGSSDGSGSSGGTTPGSAFSEADSAIAVLQSLPVKGRAPKTGYNRDQFGQRWSDNVSVEGGHNGGDTRNDILRRDLTNVELKPGSRDCVVVSGLLHDPYTGKDIPFTRGQGTSEAVQIDHVVAMSNAWQTGAQQLTAEERTNFANDPLNLLAVDGPANQKKGDGDAATWLPPQKSYRCAYVARQIEVKARYRLWVTQPEKDAMLSILDTCDTDTS